MGLEPALSTWVSWLAENSETPTDESDVWVHYQWNSTQLEPGLSQVYNKVWRKVDIYTVYGSRRPRNTASCGHGAVTNTFLKKVLFDHYVVLYVEDGFVYICTPYVALHLLFFFPPFVLFCWELFVLRCGSQARVGLLDCDVTAVLAWVSDKGTVMDRYRMRHWHSDMDCLYIVVIKMTEAWSVHARKKKKK